MYCEMNVEHPTIGDSIKKQYEDRKQRSEESGDLEVVEGLGQEAFYDTTFKTLYVLYNDEYYFEVTDKYSADPATKKSIAIKIAEKAVKSITERIIQNMHRNNLKGQKTRCLYHSFLRNSSRASGGRGFE
ncbi:MAG TPA: hypothetical protein GX736_05270 [Mogibacterium sp.]|nr:hypothetical protein [Mogibacterium sp.]